MLIAGGIWEIAKEALVKTSEDLTSGWLGKSHHLESLAESIVAHSAAGLIIAGTISFVGYLTTRRVWRVVKLSVRAAAIRKSASKAFVIVRCPILNDTNDSIGNEIASRLETEFRAFAGWSDLDTRPFEVLALPVLLTGDEGTKEYDRAIVTAKLWLDKTNGNVLIWGKRVKGDSHGIIRLIGKDRKDNVIETKRVNFDDRAADFDEALAAAIAYEAARLTQITLSEPENVTIDILRDVSRKLEKLSTANAPALNDQWRTRMADEHRRLTAEIVRRTPNIKERKKFEEEARIEIAKTSLLEEPQRFSEAALRLAILVRKRNWLDPNLDELIETRELLTRTIPILLTSKLAAQAADSAMECALVRTMELSFVPHATASGDTILSEALAQATHAIVLTDNERIRERFAAISSTAITLGPIGKLYEAQAEPTKFFELIDHARRHLDNEELITLTACAANALSNIGDQQLNMNFWRAAPQLLKATLESRSDWLNDERLLLQAELATVSNQAAIRISNTYSPDAAAPYFDIAQNTARDIERSFKWETIDLYRLIDLKILARLADGMLLPNNIHSYERSIEALRVVAGDKAEKFPRLRDLGYRSLVVALNNYALFFNVFWAAEEAYELVSKPDWNNGDEKSSPAEFIKAFAASQFARLMPSNDPRSRVDHAKHAHLIAESALDMAAKANELFYAAEAEKLLRTIEQDFPQLSQNSNLSTNAPEPLTTIPPP